MEIRVLYNEEAEGSASSMLSLSLSLSNAHTVQQATQESKSLYAELQLKERVLSKIHSKVSASEFIAHTRGLKEIQGFL